MVEITVGISQEVHPETLIIQMARLMVLFPLQYVKTDMLVSDKLEAVLAKTDEMDAANVAHLAQTISEMRGKSHGLHGIHPGMLANEFTPASGSSPTRPRSQPGTLPYWDVSLMW